MAFVRGPEPLRDPIATNNNRQCAKSAHGNGVPDVDTALIGSERREDCEASEKMRVPSKRVISQCASGLGQNHRETNECERLPKLRDFEPDEQTEETAPCNGEEAANGALVAIVAQSRQLGREIERCRENRKSHQPQAHVSMLRRFEMKIEDHAPIGGERSEQGVLYLQVRRLESAAKSRNDEHYGSERKRRPIVREKSPSGRRCRKRADIGVDRQQRAVRPVCKQIFPARTGAEGIDIKDQCADGKEH